MENCRHSSIIGDNYGETCQDCGEVLSGYGYWAEGQNYCNHRYLDAGNEYEICTFCGDERKINKFN